MSVLGKEHRSSGCISYSQGADTDILFQKIQFPVKDSTTASHISFISLEVGVGTVRSFCLLGSYFLIAGECSKAESQVTWYFW